MISGLEYEYRSGIGSDLHRLKAGNELVLGGIQIDHYAGAVAHSDGDVAIHAVIDALLGAATLGDIGEHFPDSDPALKGADSGVLLKVVKEMLADKRWEIVNVDLIIHAQMPKLSPYKGQIRRNIASLLAMDFSAMNVKAKTGEGIGIVGREEAIEAFAVVMLRRRLKRTL